MAEPQKNNFEDVCFTEMIPEDCPVLTSIRVIGGKWKIPILYTLRYETLRFNELQKALPGVTQKMLTQQLRELEKDGLVNRKVYAQVPPRVEYTTTPLARKLEPILSALCDWGSEYLKVVHGIEQTDCSQSA